MSNSNLEFRKIKSLKFLYEISEDGVIIRNVKSKKRPLTALINNEYYAYIKINGKSGMYNMRKLKEECFGKVKQQPIILIDNMTGMELAFESISKASAYLAHVLGDNNPKKYRKRLKERRSYIQGFDVDYPECRD